MNAIVSGRVGRALLIEEEKWYSFNVQTPEQLVPRTEKDLPFLFGGARDLEFYEEVDKERVQWLLAEASRNVTALDLTLISLDSSFSDGVREGALIELSSLLSHDHTKRFLMFLFCCQPFDQITDLNGALALAGESNIKTDRARSFLKNIADLQSRIECLRLKWDTIPEHLFGEPGKKKDFERQAAKTGLFYDLAVGADFISDLPFHTPEIERVLIEIRDFISKEAKKVGSAPPAQAVATSVARSSVSRLTPEASIKGRKQSLDITGLLHNWSNGDEAALVQLVPLVQAELYRLAQNYLSRERAGNSLQISDLVNEAYVRLIDRKAVQWQNRAHFFGVAAQLMRSILVDNARRRRYRKHSSETISASLAAAKDVFEERSIDVVALNEALYALAEVDRRKSQIVELRFFGGLSVQEVAEVLQISPRTVSREWSVARAWLYQELSKMEKVGAPAANLSRSAGA